MTSSLTGTRLLRPLSRTSRYINETITDAQISSRSCKAAEVSLREATVPRSCPGPATQAGLDSVGTLGFKRATYKLEFTSLKDLNTRSPRNGKELGTLRRGGDSGDSSTGPVGGADPIHVTAQGSEGTARDGRAVYNGYLLMKPRAPGHQRCLRRNGRHLSQMLQEV